MPVSRVVKDALDATLAPSQPSVEHLDPFAQLLIWPLSVHGCCWAESHVSDGCNSTCIAMTGPLHRKDGNDQQDFEASCASLQQSRGLEDNA